MGRPRKHTIPTTTPAATNGHATPPDRAPAKAGPAAPTLSKLDARAQALAQRARERKRLAVDCPPGLYERLLDAAEKWDEPIAVVMRAALERGLDALSAFPGDPRRSPFEAGLLDRAPSRIDPTGTHYPPPPAPAAMPRYAQTPQPYAPAPPPLPPIESYTENVWAPQSLPAGLLPSGGFGAPPRESPKKAPPPQPFEPRPPDPPPQPEPPAFTDPFADSEEAVARAMAEVNGAPQIDGAQALTDDLAGLL